MNSAKYKVIAFKKRTNERIEGTTNWDGLSSLFAVKTTDGTTKYVSELDNIQVLERI